MSDVREDLGPRPADRERKLISGPDQREAREKFETYMADRRGGPPPQLAVDPVVLVKALRDVGRARLLFLRDCGQEPSAIEADPMSWQIVDAVCEAVYGSDFASVVGKAWWPKEKPPRAVRRVMNGTLEPQEWRVAA